MTLPRLAITVAVTAVLLPIIYNFVFGPLLLVSCTGYMGMFGYNHVLDKCITITKVFLP